jgi:23S rRNA (adenine2030-N6)-methyltransferase
VLIDPPFEQPGEFDRLATALATAHRKWRDGIYVAWYPVKDARDAAAFARKVAGMADALRIELNVADAGAEGLRGSGLIVVNPPWTLTAELKIVLPALAKALARGRPGRTLLQSLDGPGR